MASTHGPTLRTMLELLNGLLTPSEGAEVRQQLACDLDSARRFAQLISISRSSAEENSIIRHIVAVPEDDVAAWIDDGMSFDEQSQFEAMCWNSEPLLREVISQWTLIHCREHELDLPSSRIPLMPDARTRGVDPPVSTSRSRRKIGFKPWSALLFMATGAALILAVVVHQLVQKDSQFADTGRRLDTGKQHDSEVDQRLRPELQETDPAENVPNLDVENFQGPAGHVPGLAQESTFQDSEPGIPSISANNTPDTDSRGDHASPVNAAPVTVVEQVSETAVSLHIVAGLSVVRFDEDSSWSGGMNDGAAENLRLGQSFDLMTFEQSVSEIRISESLRCILDQDSRIRWDSSLPEKITVELVHGRFVLRNLPSGFSFTLIRGDESFHLQATSDRTSIGVSYDGQQLMFAAFRGQASVNDASISRRKWLSLVGDRSVDSLTAPANPVEWGSRGPAAEFLPAAMAQFINKAADVPVAIQNLPAGTNFQTSFRCAEVLLQCSIRHGAVDEAGQELFRRLANSPSEAEREAVIYWMLKCLRQKSENSESTLVMLLTTANVPEDVRDRVSNWFLKAVDESAPSTALLAELQTALRDTRSVFVRQAAKTFLKLIINDPLSEYDAFGPNDRSTYQSIARKLRAWQQRNPQ